MHYIKLKDKIIKKNTSIFLINYIISMKILKLIFFIIILYLINILYYGLNEIIERNSKITNDPILPNNTFKECMILKKNWKVINYETKNILEEKLEGDITKDGLFKNISIGTWNRFYIKWGKIDEMAKIFMPNTCKLIESLPNIQTAFISILDPNANITPHEGPFKGFVRIHLGLDTPQSDDCYISVDNKKLIWKNGEILLFDDTYTHYVKNNTNKKRIILFCDIIRPTRIPIHLHLLVKLIMIMTWRNNLGQKSKLHKIFPELS